jgi:hypothetical protein
MEGCINAYMGGIKCGLRVDWMASEVFGAYLVRWLVFPLSYMIQRIDTVYISCGLFGQTK